MFITQGTLNNQPELIVLVGTRVLSEFPPSNTRQKPWWVWLIYIGYRVGSSYVFGPISAPPCCTMRILRDSHLKADPRAFHDRRAAVVKNSSNMDGRWPSSCFSLHCMLFWGAWCDEFWLVVNCCRLAEQCKSILPHTLPLQRAGYPLIPRHLYTTHFHVPSISNMVDGSWSSNHV